MFALYGYFSNWPEVSNMSYFECWVVQFSSVPWCKENPQRQLTFPVWSTEQTKKKKNLEEVNGEKKSLSKSI